VWNKVLKVLGNRTGREEQPNNEQENNEQLQRTTTTRLNNDDASEQRQQADSTSGYRFPARLRTGIEQDRTPNEQLKVLWTA